MSRRIRKTKAGKETPSQPANIRVARNRGLERTSLMQWLAQHRAALRAALSQLGGHRIGSMVNVLVIGLALALPLLLDHAVRNLAQVGGALDEQRDITVFLDPALDRAAVDVAMRELHAIAGIASIRRRTPEQGLSDLRQLPGFEAAATALDRNPLPWVALVTPADAVEQGDLVARLEVVAGVDLVQHDAVWRERLDRILSLLRRVVYVLAGLLGVGAMLLIANAIRIDVMARREEISIVSLLGGSDAYVRRPFLYGGALYGVLGAIAAIVLLWAVHLAVRDPVAALSETYAADFRLSTPNLASSAAALAVGLVLGWIGALVAATLQLLSDRAD
ncbi:MAG: ABC transporter permease [Rhodanobacteraceae bacterium]|nr:ABC transporter permease [Rhodanobacteraceae bacterium]